MHAQCKVLPEYETMSNYFENVCESLPPLRVLVVRQHHFLAKFAAQLVVGMVGLRWAVWAVWEVWDTGKLQKDCGFLGCLLAVAVRRGSVNYHLAAG